MIGRWIRSIQAAIRPKDNRKGICIVGLGGLGSHCARMLCLTLDVPLVLVDHDTVELSNLHRTALYNESDIGKPKALAILPRLKAIAPTAVLRCHNLKLTERRLQLLHQIMVLDCTDSTETKLLINSYCIKHGIPLVSCSVAGDHGFVKSAGEGCMGCILSKKLPEQSKTAGILSSTVMMGASLQVALALRLLESKPFAPLLSFDAWKPQISEIEIPERSRCGVCSK